MGFLDRMVADLISNATGLPVKGLVRKLGAKKLLLGGAALAAGGLAVAKMQEAKGPSPAAAPASTTPPPPLPPTPVANSLPPAPLPPLPPVPTPPEAEIDLSPDLTAAIVRTMIAAALADGHLATAEREAIHSNLQDSGLSPEQISRAHSDLLDPASPATLAALILKDSDREVLYRSAFLIIMADQEFAEAERCWLDDLAQHLNLDNNRKAAIEGELRGVEIQT